MIHNLNLKSGTTSEIPTKGHFPSPQGSHPLQIHLVEASEPEGCSEEMEEQDRSIFQMYLSTTKQIRMPTRRCKFLPEWGLQDLAKVAFLRIPEELSLQESWAVPPLNQLSLQPRNS